MPLLNKNEDGQWQLGAAELPDWQSDDALVLAGDAELPDDLEGIAAVGIEFPAFNDGRGLSLAVLIRTRLGFTGDLVALGAVHEDILHYMRRCGFNMMQLPDDRDAEVALSLLAPYTDHYQASVEQTQPSFRR